jgi:hypothetical protein
MFCSMRLWETDMISATNFALNEPADPSQEGSSQKLRPASVEKAKNGVVGYGRSGLSSTGFAQAPDS